MVSFFTGQTDMQNKVPLITLPLKYREFVKVFLNLIILKIHQSEWLCGCLFIYNFLILLRFYLQQQQNKKNKIKYVVVKLRHDKTLSWKGYKKKKDFFADICISSVLLLYSKFISELQ